MKLIIGLLLFSTILWADRVILKSGATVEGEIFKIDFYVVEIKTDLGQRIIAREEISRICVNGKADMPELEIEIKRRLYLLPVFIGLGLITIDILADADRLDAQVRRGERLGLDTGDAKTTRNRKYALGIITGLASMATLAIAFDEVQVAVLPNQVEIRYEF